MKIIKIFLFMLLTVLSFSAAALTVQSGNYDKTFNDPGMREDLDNDYQDDKEAYQEDPSQAQQNAKNMQSNYQSHAAARGR